MKKRIILAILGVLVLIGVLGGIKGLQISEMIAQGEQFVPPPETVTTSTVTKDAWEIVLTSVGSLVAVQGVTVTAELTGKVERIAFEAGARVSAGDLLVQQDVSSEQAQLRAAEAAFALAKANLDRSTQLLSEEVIARSTYDQAVTEYKKAAAEIDNIRTIIAKKTIRAPFDGRLGIRHVNLGQVINEGEPIVSLQALDPIFVDFSLPQQELSRIRDGLEVRVTSDALPVGEMRGTITAINPLVDPATRNVRIQATLENPDELLRPGMYVNVAVVMPRKEEVLAIPATSVLHAPYSDSVFIVEEQGNPEVGKPSGTVRQQFVRLGRKRGDFVSITSGLKEGEIVVSTGAFKLRNGQSVVVDNSLRPEFNLEPKPEQS
ncbi:MAG: efflux RND transporter periplasmic adaptor subunit [Desulfobacterales bacterium]